MGLGERVFFFEIFRYLQRNGWILGWFMNCMEVVMFRFMIMM